LPLSNTVNLDDDDGGGDDDDDDAIPLLKCLPATSGL
jgi:hypothetical protein